MGCCCAKFSGRVSSVKVNSRTVYDTTREDAGPVEERACTDLFFLIIFVAYVIFLLFAVGTAGARGDPRRLIYGVDRNGNLCGVSNKQISGNNKSGQDMTSMKYLVMQSECTGSNCNFSKTCQAQCPENYKLTTLRRCVAQSISSSANRFKSALPWFEEVGSDISLCWPHILLLCIISIGLSVALLLVFRFCASIIIWAVLIVVALAAVALTIFLWVSWNSNKKEVANMADDLPGKDLQEKRGTYWLIAAIVATVFTVIYLLIVFIMRKRIGLVAALFQEAGKALGAMPFILLQPIWTFIGEAVVCTFVIMGFVCLQSSGEPQVEAENGEVTFPINTFFQVARWLLLFGFFWMTQFVLACQHLVVSGAVSYWYFTRDKEKLYSPIIRSLCNTIKSHLGSAALGSLLIALIKFIRTLFRMLEKSLGEQGNKHPMLWKMLQCCMACFESYLKFLSRNAFIMIAMYGEAFCSSARRAFSLLSANCMRLAAIESIGDFVLFVGKVGVVIANAFIGLEIVKTVEGVHYIWVPVGLSCIFSYLICHCFLSVYEMAIDTLLLDFCDDTEKNDGVSRPYYMSRSLMVFVEGSTKGDKYRDTGKDF